MYLAYQTPGMPSLERDDESPPYIPQNIRELNVPDDVPEPEAYAKAWFRREWKLEKAA